MLHLKFIITISLVFGFTINCQQKNEENMMQNTDIKNNNNLKEATFGGGCFWCTEAVFQRIEGVEEVISGYSGGDIKNPSYREVCTGRTGHAEVIRVLYDPEKVKYEELLEVFFKTHDPTTLNRQGNDVGTQYRSVIFYHDEQQEKIAKEVKEKLSKAGIWTDPIVTEISPVKNFYKAEEYHQNYFNNNKNQPYCRIVIIPKLEKFEEVFGEMVK